MSDIPSISTISSLPAACAAVASSLSVGDMKDNNYDFDPCLSEDERRFYLKAYPTVDLVRDRKVHCTVCKSHIGTAPVQENSIKMHPILRVTHCMKCHDFYNSGEFSKGEDGSELYCRWCGQGGEVYCCSSCPYVFCKSCIIKNLSRGVVVDIEQNENWNCFSCAPKILWPLRAQHWALMRYIEQQKNDLSSLNLSEVELRQQMSMDRSKCCRLAKAKCGNMSDSLESLDSITSKRSYGSNNSIKKKLGGNDMSPQAKRPKNNDEVVCTPDLLSMLEPDCQITMAKQKNAQRPMPSASASAPKVMSLKTPYAVNSNTLTAASNTTGLAKSSVPPPLVLRNTGIKVRPGMATPVVRRTIIGPRTPTPGGAGTPVYHTINGYRIDLNSAAQQETFRLPNGKLIQVKRQGTLPLSSSNTNNNTWQQQTQRPLNQSMNPMRQVHATQHSNFSSPANMQQQQQQQHNSQLPLTRYHNSGGGGASTNHNGTTSQTINGQMVNNQQSATGQANVTLRPVMVRHVFPETPIGQARSKLQDQVFSAMEICTHLSNKVQTLTNSNAYKQAKNYLEVKELYIHLSYLLTYSIGRFKGLQDKCLADMRQLGFGNDADCLENGQLAAGVDYVCYGQLDDVDLFNTGSNSFHNQVYEYRKSLHANLKDEDGSKSPLPPIFSLGVGRDPKNSETKNSDREKDADMEEDSLLEDGSGIFKGHWLEGRTDSPLIMADNDENDEPDDTLIDNDNDDEDSFGGANMYRSTEDSMRRNEESHSFDRKLTRLVSQYPSIWCTRHPDYGNFEVTRKQWNTIAAHFRRSINIKLRWKNIRKRFVRIEKRIAEGKRFNGHFDKAMAFLANRDLPEDQWVPVDCGDDDGDTYDRRTLDAIERSLTLQGRDEFSQQALPPPLRMEMENSNRERYCRQSVRPINIKDIDMRIINYVKANPVLWRKSMDPETDKQDELNRIHLWNQLRRHFPQYSCEDIRDRWQHLYEMYKTFRLKAIKSSEERSLLELKYSKYLAKLYFLYKIDEEEMRNENIGLFEDCFELDEDDDEGQESGQEQQQQNETEKCSTQKLETQTKLQDMPDDRQLLEQLVRLVQKYPAIWNAEHPDHMDIMIRDNYWQEINEQLSDFKRDVKTIKLRWALAKFSYFRWRRENGQTVENSKMDSYCKNLPFEDKQASDDEDNEIEIVEPKTDLITLDSDDEEITTTTNSTNKSQTSVANTTQSSNQENNYSRSKTSSSAFLENDLMTVAQNLLASMLEVEINDSSGGNGLSQFSPNSTDCSFTTSINRKQPRKKTTNKPNPTLIKQKKLMEMERLQELKRNDVKLKMNCAVKLRKAEEEYPYAKEILNAKFNANINPERFRKQEKLAKDDKEILDENPTTTIVVETGNESVQLEVVLEDEVNNSNSSQNQNTLESEIDMSNTFSSEGSGKCGSAVESTLNENNDVINKSVEEVNAPEVDSEDLDVDKEIAKVLQSSNLNRSRDERECENITTITIEQPHNLKDTMDRAIEKLITAGLEDTNHSLSHFSAKVLHRNATSEI